MPDRLTRNEKKGAAVGAGGAALAMPTRVFSNAKKNPYRNMKSGPHSVPMSDVHAAAQRPGRRIQNRPYTANLAQGLRDSPNKGELTVAVSRDGHASQVDGAHRTWANTMNGEKRMNVNVIRTDAERPVKSLAGNISGEVRDRIHRRRLRLDTNLTREQVDARAAKMNHLTPDRNQVASDFRQMVGRARGKGHGLESSIGSKVGPSALKLHSKQGAYLAGGAAAGVGAVRLTQKKDKVSKSLSAFGVDHG